MGRGYHVVSKGTDNHLLLVDTRKSKKLPGKRVAKNLEKIGMACNFNTVPNASDKQKPLAPDGIRIGTPCITTRGFKETDIDRLVEFLDLAMSNIRSGKIPKGESPWVDPSKVGPLHDEVKAFASEFPTFKYG